MKSHGIWPNAVTYNAVVDVCCKCGDIARAEATIAQMQAEGNPPDAITFNMLLHACCKYQQPDRVFTTLAKMRQLGVVPNAVTVNTLVTNFTGDRAQLDKALADVYTSQGP